MRKDEKRLVWTKFVWESWLSDPGLRTCSAAARGVWIDMLAVMGLSREYGVLLINGKVPSTEKLARFIGVPEDTLEKLLEELIENGVPSKRMKDSALFSRRMVREERERAGDRKRQMRSRKRKADAPESHADVTDTSQASHADVTQDVTGRGRGRGRERGRGRDRNPPIPQGGTGKVQMVDPTGIRIAGWFKRRPRSPWSPKEVKAFTAILPLGPSELELMEDYYTAEIEKKSDIRRRDLITLLNNWPGEKDRARRWRDERAADPRNNWQV